MQLFLPIMLELACLRKQDSNSLGCYFSWCSFFTPCEWEFDFCLGFEHILLLIKMDGLLEVHIKFFAG